MTESIGNKTIGCNYSSMLFSIFWFLAGQRWHPDMHPDSKVHGANMGPTWVLSAPDGPHVGPMNLAIRVVMYWKQTDWCCHALLPCSTWVNDYHVPHGSLINSNLQLVKIMAWCWIHAKQLFKPMKTSIQSQVPKHLCRSPLVENATWHKQPW